MTSTFPTFARIVADSFQSLVKSPHVFVADIDGDALWARYLAAFPEGTDPIFVKKTEHDCGCCKNFVRRAGAVVAIKDGEVRTVWDAAGRHASPGHYATVATALAEAVRSSGIRDIFRVSKNEVSFGAAVTRSLNADGKALSWNHFYTGEIPRGFRSAMPDTERGHFRTTVQVFERGLTELTADAVETVIGLIESNALYRGEEHKRAVVEFQRLQRSFHEQRGIARSRFAWAHAASPAARFRNTAIGTLVQDLSEGQSLETAVKAFETKVAPQNYKRTTALITPGMVKKAMETITELGLEPALERRLATLADVSVNDVLWVDGAARPLMKGGIADVLAKHVAMSSVPKEDRAEEVALSDFMGLLPEVQGMELFFSGRHLGNLAVITAPVHPEPARLFRWNNDFSWSYAGNVADSIRERVKKAGGRVEGALRVSLSWYNFDDLDLHVYEPQGRGMQGLGPDSHIHYRNKRGWTGGTLDVDMNAGHGHTREPVENVVWVSAPPDGAYRVVVNNYCRRESANPGFVIEVENAGKVSHYSFNKGVSDRQDITVVTLHLKNGLVERVEAGDPGITSSMISQEKWGLATERYVKVSTVMLSPNHWAGAGGVGNKHTFFVLDGCKSDEDARGFYNEFLHPRLEEHRKVFEVIADKTKCRPTEGHLAGLGFSSTKPDVFRVRVTQGKRVRVFDVRVA